VIKALLLIEVTGNCGQEKVPIPSVNHWEKGLRRELEKEHHRSDEFVRHRSVACSYVPKVQFAMKEKERKGRPGGFDALVPPSYWEFLFRER
jgi:hypothetical protein